MNIQYSKRLFLNTCWGTRGRENSTCSRGWSSLFIWLGPRNESTLFFNTSTSTPKTKSKKLKISLLAKRKIYTTSGNLEKTPTKNVCLWKPKLTQTPLSLKSKTPTSNQIPSNKTSSLQMETSIRTPSVTPLSTATIPIPGLISLVWTVIKPPVGIDQ